MITELGKFLRKLRIDNTEILKTMADSLGVSASFLSAVENGKKKMPAEWKETIISSYNLNENQINEFEKAIMKTEEEITIRIDRLSEERQNLAISFARKLNTMSDEDIEKIRKIFEKDGEDE